MGAHYRFRYECKYVEEKTRARWEKPGDLTGKPVAIYFSIQHIASFHPAVFVPLRRGEVVNTFIEGGTYVVYFRLGDYLPLKDESSWTDQTRRATPVRKFTEGLQHVDLLGEKQPDQRIHATIGKELPASLVKPSGNAGLDFEAIVRFLTPSLSFSPRLYFRVARVTQDADEKPVSLDTDGNLPLTAGTNYKLHLAQYQLQPLPPNVLLEISSPAGVDIVGDSRIVLSSRYDMIPIRLFPRFRDDSMSGQLMISTCEPALGPTIRLPLTISPSKAHKVSGPVLAVGGAAAIALPPILGSGQNVGWRIAFALAGTVAVGLGIWWRRARGFTG